MLKIVMGKRTKIVCTIGPASRDEATLRAMIRAGMDVARINFAHGTYPEHAADIANIRRIAQEEGATVAVLADLQGPKLRIGAIASESLLLTAGDRLTLTTREASDAEKVVHLPHWELIDEATVGTQLLLDDGELEFVVEEKAADALVCRVVTGGKLRSHKGIAAVGGRSGGTQPAPSRPCAITPKDREDLAFALSQGIDFLALSYVRDADDINELRTLVREVGGEGSDVAIIAKIEKRAAIDHFDAILDAADAIMVARGDLGVEVSVQEVPLHQKTIIRKCNVAGKPVITATQMLQSMVENPRPTRAEASDVANAILDGTDAVMLSAETAVGRHPVEAVVMMATIAATAEQKMLRWVDPAGFGDVEHRHPITDAISDATATIARELDARLIVVSTWSGYTARQVARERPREPIVACTPNKSVVRKLALTWGAIPVLVPQYEGTDEMLKVMANKVLELELAERGDLVVVTGGLPVGGGGRTNFLKVHRL